MRHSLLLPLLLLPALFLGGLLCGSQWIAPAEVWEAMMGTAGSDPLAHSIVCELRLPALLTALLAGSALGVAGLLMQTVFDNPLADPSILGVNAGAGLGAAVCLLLMGGALGGGVVGTGGLLTVSLGAFIGAAGVMAVLGICASVLRHHLMLLVAGVMISYAVGAVVTLLSFFASADGLRSYVVWGRGSYGSVGTDTLPVFAALVAVGLLVSLCLGKPLNALLLGDAYAQNLGYRLRPLRMAILALGGGLCAMCTALCGPIAFIGLAVPHVARLTLRTADHRLLLPATLLWGADISLACHLISLIGGAGMVLPLNAITALVGVPVALLIMRKGQRG